MEGEGQEEELSVLLMGEKEEKRGEEKPAGILPFFLALDLQETGMIKL